MSTIRQSSSRRDATRPVIALAAGANRLIAALPAKARRELIAGGESVSLVFAEELCRAHKPISHVYFPTEGFISLVTEANGAAGQEIGLIGNEGMLGVSLVLGLDPAPFRGLVQGSGSALRVTAARFVKAFGDNPTLHRLLDRYFYVVMAQLARLTACNQHHDVDARLARWLLMTHDRALSDEFRLTHQFLAMMLGVRREGVTEAAGRLQKRRIIEYRRGQIQVLDRRGLAAAACNCYQADLTDYARILG